MARRRKPDPDVELDPDEIEELEAEGALDSRGLLRDGARLHVPLYLKDGAINPNLTATQRGKALQQTEDAIAHKFGLADGLQLHKPGFRRVTDAAALERTRQAYAAYDAADAIAYKHTRDYEEHTGSDPSRTGAGAPAKGSNASPGSYPYSAAAEGSACTINGAPGTLVRQGNSLVCQPRRSQDAASIKAAAYAQYDAEQTNAWRMNK